MRPTMADVAELAGVSISTVSLVLNEKPGISLEVREAVRRAVEELGYQGRERRAEKNVAPPKNITIVHYASPESSYRFEGSGLFVDYVTSIQGNFQGQNVNWKLISDFQENGQDNLSSRLLNGSLSDDGFILMGIQSPDSPFLQQIIASNKPVVILSRDWPDLPVSVVTQDYRQQATIALSHLIELGHRKIGFLARNFDQGFDWFETRLECYRSVLSKNGIAVDDSLITIDVNGAEAATALMARRPDVTAIFAVHDENAVAAIRGLQDAGYRIPEDVSVIGQDDSAQLPDGYPGLTTVTFSHDKAGSLAVETLMHQLKDEMILRSKTFIHSFLLERESCAAPQK
jgi:LacI family transcriptional regulator